MNTATGAVLFTPVTWVLVLLPVVLLGFDIMYKWAIYRRPPHDSVADIALAGLTFNIVHVLTKLVHATAPSMNAWAFVWVMLQFMVWPLCLFWAARLQASGLGLMILSYALGAAWFTYSTMRVLTLLP